MKDPADNIWAYLHGELSPTDRHRFEQALEADAELRANLEACQSTHRDLEELLPLRECNDTTAERLEQSLLVAWEAEHPEFKEAPVRSSSRIIRLGFPLAAAAAAMFLLLALPHNNSPIQWERTFYGDTPQLRGQLSLESGYARSDLRQAGRELRQAIESQYNASGDNATSWYLRMAFQEVADGQLMVEVSGRQINEPPDVLTWNGDFPSLEQFHQQIPAFGSRIAKGLAEHENP